jgi:uncharacterized protein
MRNTMSSLRQDPRFQLGLEQFNSGQFYACHDSFEALWHEAVEPDRQFLQGVLQIAVGLYHLSRQNPRGAAILLGEGIGRLRDYQPEYVDLDVAELVLRSRRLLEQLQQTGVTGSPLGLEPLGLTDPPVEGTRSACPYLRPWEDQSGTV